mmetsp:Transcript_90431/g.245195  ORF Transcript_90431/g.245195 Transcript_90431/m.245195 type:complete len:211 (-) Transcript_90431:70-702(-)
MPSSASTVSGSGSAARGWRRRRCAWSSRSSTPPSPCASFPSPWGSMGPSSTAPSAAAPPSGTWTSGSRPSTRGGTRSARCPHSSAACAGRSGPEPPLASSERQTARAGLWGCARTSAQAGAFKFPDGWVRWHGRRRHPTCYSRVTPPRNLQPTVFCSPQPPPCALSPPPPPPPPHPPPSRVAGAFRPSAARTRDDTRQPLCSRVTPPCNL